MRGPEKERVNLYKQGKKVEKRARERDGGPQKKDAIPLSPRKRNKR